DGDGDRVENARQLRRSAAMEIEELLSKAVGADIQPSAARRLGCVRVVAEPICLAGWPHRVPEEGAAAEDHVHRSAGGWEISPDDAAEIDDAGIGRPRGIGQGALPCTRVNTVGPDGRVPSR